MVKGSRVYIQEYVDNECLVLYFYVLFMEKPKQNETRIYPIGYNKIELPKEEKDENIH